MDMKKATSWFTLFMTLLAAAFVVLSLTYNPSAKLFPLIIGIPTLIAGIVILLSNKWPRLIKSFEVNIKATERIQAAATPETAAEPHEVELPSELARKRVLAISAWIAGYFIVIVMAGFIIANFLLTILYLKIHARSGWLMSFIMAAVLAGSMWFVFDYLMKADMFAGILFGEWIPPL